jgi:hypothetical protein
MTKHKKIKLKQRILFVIVIGVYYLTKDYINAGLTLSDNGIYRLTYMLVTGFSFFWIVIKVFAFNDSIIGNKNRHYEIIRRAKNIHRHKKARIKREKEGKL